MCLLISLFDAFEGNENPQIKHLETSGEGGNAQFCGVDGVGACICIDICDPVDVDGLG